MTGPFADWWCLWLFERAARADWTPDDVDAAATEMLEIEERLELVLAEA